MRYRFIEAEKAWYSIDQLCRVLNVARSGFYAWRQQPMKPRTLANQWLLTQIRACHQEFHGRYGSPRIHQELRGRGIVVGRHRVARLMRGHGIQSVCRRRWRLASRSRPDGSMARNLLERDFTATRPKSEAEKAWYSIDQLCRVLNVARSGFYAWRQQPMKPRTLANQWLLTQIRACHQEFHGRYGSPRIHQELRGRGIVVVR